jgi:hypothetical protein
MRKYAEDEVDRLNGTAGKKVATTLEKTPGGKYFDDMNMYTDAPLKDSLANRQKNRVWGRLSERYADGASGQVNSQVHLPRKTSIYLNDELPALRSNPNVTEIVEHDPVPLLDGSLPPPSVYPGGGATR